MTIPNQLTANPFIRDFRFVVAEVAINPTLKVHFLVGNSNPLTMNDFKEQVVENFQDDSLFSTQIEDLSVLNHLINSHGLVSANLF